MKREKEKHLSFFDLLDAFRAPGCAFCSLVSAKSRRYMDTLLYEFVNDPGFRETWRKTRGFCHRHAWMLAEWEDGLGLGILYLDLVRNHGTTLLEEPVGTDCPVCESEKTDLDERILELNQFGEDPELLEAIKNSDGICGPHLRYVQHQISNESLREYLRVASEKHLEDLRRDLEALVESYDYRGRVPRDTKTAGAWRRAIESISGIRDLPPLVPPKKKRWKL